MVLYTFAARIQYLQFSYYILIVKFVFFFLLILFLVCYNIVILFSFVRVGNVCGNVLFVLYIILYTYLLKTHKIRVQTVYTVVIARIVCVVCTHGGNENINKTLSASRVFAAVLNKGESTSVMQYLSTQNQMYLCNVYADRYYKDVCIPRVRARYQPGPVLRYSIGKKKKIQFSKKNDHITYFNFMLPIIMCQ